MKITPKPTIGRREKITMPDLSNQELDAKIDTGAYSSSIHCQVLGEELIHGEKYVRIIPPGKGKERREILLKVLYEKPVKSSSGHTEERYFVELRVKFAEWDVPTRFSLSNRSGMKYTILLGRRFLKKRFVVDVARSYVYYKKALRKARKSKINQ